MHSSPSIPTYFTEMHANPAKSDCLNSAHDKRANILPQTALTSHSAVITTLLYTPHLTVIEDNTSQPISRRIRDKCTKLLTHFKYWSCKIRKLLV